MRKVAVFVEGQAELILVRELLLCMYDYQQVGIECYMLRSGEYTSVPYLYGSRNESHFYMLVNVGNDSSVLSQMKKRAERLFREGFCKIIGLRDMYSEQYRNLVFERKINAEINACFIDAHRAQIERMPSSEKISFFFAIMEIEAWLLGMKEVFTRMDARLTVDYIKEQLHIDLEHADPETTYFHPAKHLGEILHLAGRHYNKHESEISSLINLLSRSDYEALYHDPTRCSTFTAFVTELLN